jgi:intracellular multiplication protein IcmB
MYMLARHALVTQLVDGQRGSSGANAGEIPRLITKAAFALEIAESPKRLCYDEFHRTSKSSVRAQIVRDVREGRKRGMQIVLASQMLDDFDDDMVDLATGVWVLGTAISDKAVDEVQERFGLSDTARRRHSLQTDRSESDRRAVPVRAGHDRGPLRTASCITHWARSSCGRFRHRPEDVAIRNRLYELFQRAEMLRQKSKAADTSEDMKAAS